MSEDPRDTSNLYSPSSSHRGETNNSTLELFRLAFHLYLTLHQPHVEPYPKTQTDLRKIKYHNTRAFGKHLPRLRSPA
ncbi:hypothetical protein KM472_gp047 [Cynomolgus macaque cytomegalovirus strain Ottawa]|uniref:Uncharacterized protein n=2 Tax=Cytomegalovirus TaxID=10358 RepID=G8H150_9BETA|nr:hypothetical protein KM472_gp047 [Cynomolgus macaque cytomegalovirus strain Ottawa]AEQ32124.1 hypothetical protein cy47 [Cynomolgus macaque cytomegalovirus strain Ottawa]AKT72889.1 hypothetical protein [Cynomolgus macaque cytomegalovirus strain Mauritius]AXG21742.1 hypothetical protein [synthetic construct]AXG22010.1 hypothetical protein [synthetic construct]